MKLVSFLHQGGEHVGALEGDRVVPLVHAYREYLHSRGGGASQSMLESILPGGMVPFLEGGERAMSLAREMVRFADSSGPDGNRSPGEQLTIPLAGIDLLAPLPRPGKLLCIGLNYRDHAAELNMQLPERPLLFAKYSNAVVGHGAPIVLPRISHQVDYEAELAVVIGKRAKGVSPDEAMEYVAGYTIMNDVSARDIQFSDGQWVRGKTFDSFAPLGPALVTSDEVPDPHNLAISLRVNGRTMQESNTRNLLFQIPQLIAFLSEAITLEPGDVIATGTPPGVGHNRKPPVYLRPGDVVTIEVEKVGTLENPVVAED